MIEILIKDILPIFVIMFLGYAAGKRGVFSTSDPDSSRIGYRPRSGQVYVRVCRC